MIVSAWSFGMEKERSAGLESGSDSQVRSRAVDRIATGTTARIQVHAMTRRPGSRVAVCLLKV